MLIKSPAGEFPITIEGLEIDGNEPVIMDKMGMWDARTHVGARDFLAIMGKLMTSPAVLSFAAKALFLARRKSARE